MRYKIHLSQIPDISDITLEQRYLPNFESSDDGFILTSNEICTENVFLLLEDNSLYWMISDQYLQNPPLFGRPFIHKTFDCYTFARDYLLQEFGIILPSVAYEDDWWNTGQNLYLDAAKDAGFILLPAGSKVRVGDLFALRMRSPVINHIGIYVGDKKIAHHNGGEVSKIETLRPAHWRFCEGIYRHESLLCDS